MAGIAQGTDERVAGDLSEARGIRVEGTLADGRTGQAADKNAALLAFARRVCEGAARPDEVAFMTALMAQDIPE